MFVVVAGLPASGIDPSQTLHLSANQIRFESASLSKTSASARLPLLGDCGVGWVTLPSVRGPSCKGVL
jgi:hypothetical protein